MRFLSIAALTLLGVAMISCDTVDNAIFLPQQIQQQAQTNNTVTLKTTVSIGGGAAEARGATRALDEHGHKTFAVGDRIAVVYKNTSDNDVKTESLALTADDIASGGKSATFTVTLVNPKAEGDVKYIYPAAMANSDGSVNYAALNEQDGTLATLQANLDFAMFEGKLTAEAGLPTGSMTNRLAICTYLIKNNAGTKDITNTIKNMIISDGTNAYFISREPAEGPIYVAMIPTDHAKIQYKASDNEEGDYPNFYTKDVTDKTYLAGNLYHLGIRMSITDGRIIDLKTLTLEDDFYTDDGDILTGTLGLVGNHSILISGSITLCNATINGRTLGGYGAGLTTAGDATIVLEGDNTITGFDEDYPGIEVGDGHSLTISGSGSLNVSSYGNGAGIGSHSYSSGVGIIYIDGGNITASSVGGAGIGAGNSSSCNDIVINGGTISATGGDRSAGIGSADYGSTFGNITIYGGTITATGGGYASGIGSGNGGSGGNIEIYGGTIIASSLEEGAGIGAGYNGWCNNITINGGTITATGGDEASGIGTSRGGVCQDINITGGNITARGGDFGAGIGSGAAGACDNITITDGMSTITAINWAKNYIGAGTDATCGTVTIDGVENATTGSTFTHFNSIVTTTYSEDDTWTLTHY